MGSITTRGPAQPTTRDGNSGDQREGVVITGTLLAAVTRPDPEVAESPQPHAHPVIPGPDLPSDPRPGRIGERWEGVYPRCAPADPWGGPSGAVGHD